VQFLKTIGTIQKIKGNYYILFSYLSWFMVSILSKFKNIEKHFGDISGKIDNNPIELCFEKGCNGLLGNFDRMLSLLEKSNLDFLIEEYMKKGINDENRIYSFISEIRAGAYLSYKGFPIKYIAEGKTKTPDMQTKIKDKNAFVEVKRISERRWDYDKLNKEFVKKNINYDIEIYLNQVVFSASDVISEIEKSIPDKVKETYTIIPFKYGSFRVRKMKLEKPIFNPTVTYSILQTKNEREKANDSYISLDEIESGIMGDLDDSIDKFDEYCEKSDLCFVFLDDTDVHNYGHPELKSFLYGGVSEAEVVNGKIINKKHCPISEVNTAKEFGWSKILHDLDFNTGKIDYSDRKGWFLYYGGAEKINGVFHCFGYDFNFGLTYCFLNPFVNKRRNFSELENILNYFRE